MPAPAPVTMPSRPVPTGQERPRSADLHRVLGLRMPVAVVLAERRMSVEEILAFQVGTIIEFEVPFDHDLSLYVANTPIGRGQAVKVGENFGLRIARIDPVRERIDALRPP